MGMIRSVRIFFLAARLRRQHPSLSARESVAIATTIIWTTPLKRRFR